MNTMSKYTTPQPAPWFVGTELIYIGDLESGFVENGKTTWSHKHGVRYTVIENHEPDGYDTGEDEDGNKVTYPVHGWSSLQSELDPERKRLSTWRVCTNIE